MSFKGFTTGRGLWFSSLGVLTVVALAFVVFRAISGSSEQVDVERLIKEDKALVAEASASITITETGPSSLAKVDTVPALLVVPAGETTAIIALAYDQEGRQWRDTTFRWRVTDPKVGTISRGGIFTAGFTTGTFENAIVVEAVDRVSGASVEDRATVTVIEAGQDRIPAAIRVFPSEIEVEPSGSLKLVAFAVDLNGVMVPGTPLDWELLEPRAGTVDSKGQFTASETTGNFLEALRVSISPGDLRTSDEISNVIDVRILGRRDGLVEPYVAVLPQAVTLTPDQEVKFSVVVLDSQGVRLSPVEVQWKLQHSRAGTLTPDGRFRAGDTPGTYDDLVKAHITTPDYQQGYSTRVSATVIITDASQVPTEDGLLARTVIFPGQVVLSPGEFTNIYLVGTDVNGQRLSNLRIDWSLAAPELGQITQGGRLAAGTVPGVYPDGIVALASVQTDSGTQTIETSATLIIRGPLDRVVISPTTAEVGHKGIVQFVAIAYDGNNVSIPNMLFQWEVEGSEIGEIDRRGLFIAKGPPGEYPDAVRVRAIQIIPET